MKLNISVSHKNGKVIVDENDWVSVLQYLEENGFRVRQTFKPAQQSVHWTAFAVLVAAVLMLGIFIGRLAFGG